MKRHVMYCVSLMLAGMAGVSAQSPAQKPSADLLVRAASVPFYPPVLLAARLAGTVRLTVTVRKGSVVDVEAASDAHQLFANAAIENVKTWRFSRETGGTFRTTYIYELRADEADVPENPRIELQLPSLVRIVGRPTKPTCHDCGGGNSTQPVR